jgi:hypothetical protein
MGAVVGSPLASALVVTTGGLTRDAIQRGRSHPQACYAHVRRLDEVTDTMLVGRWVEWEWGSRVVAAVLRTAAAALEAVADWLEGTKPPASVAIMADELQPFMGTRGRINDTLDRARDRYEEVTSPATTANHREPRF